MIRPVGVITLCLALAISTPYAWGACLGFGKESGIHLGGLWVGDANYPLSGGANPGTWSFNCLFILDMGLDLNKLLNISGAMFGAEFLLESTISNFQYIKEN